MSKVYVISDTHFNHRNIIDYTTRINYLDSKDIVAMEEMIVERWNSVVTENDIVYHLGDFGFGGKEMFTRLVGRLKGRIRLLLGNHDPKKSQRWYLDAGFDRVYEFPFILDKWFIMSHAPIPYLTEVMPYINIHGHTHDECYANPQRYNVSWEITKGVPILFSDIKAHYVELEELDGAAKDFWKNRHGEGMNYGEGYMAGLVDNVKKAF